MIRLTRAFVVFTFLLCNWSVVLETVRGQQGCCASFRNLFNTLVEKASRHVSQEFVHEENVHHNLDLFVSQIVEETVNVVQSISRLVFPLRAVSCT